MRSITLANLALAALLSLLTACPSVTSTEQTQMGELTVALVVEYSAVHEAFDLTMQKLITANPESAASLGQIRVDLAQSKANFDTVANKLISIIENSAGISVEESALMVSTILNAIGKQQ